MSLKKKLTLSSCKTMLMLAMLCVSFDLQAFVYECVSKGHWTSVYILTVDPKEDVIIPVKAQGEKVARETVLTLARRQGASAAINGGFWKWNGEPAGILKIDHIWYGTPLKPRGAIGWSLNHPRGCIDRVLTNCQLTGVFEEGEIEVVPMSTSSEVWQEFEHIVGGTPVLVQDGELIKDFSPEQTLHSFLVRRHPRTAVGIKETGEWIFVVVDGCFYGLLGGMTIKKLAQFMLELGCVDALNLDGGGSSTMVVGDVVVNDPCGSLHEEGKKVEAVSDAFLIFSGQSS